MTRVNISISGVPCQIPSLEGQHATVNIVREKVDKLSYTFATKYGVLGWVLRSNAAANSTHPKRVSNAVQGNNVIQPPLSAHRPTPPHLSSSKRTSLVWNIGSSQNPSSVVTLQVGYLAQQSNFNSTTFSGDSFLRVLCAFPLRSLRLMHVILLITFFLITISSLSAQTAYTGGPGDGHAMGELQLRTVGSAELSASQGHQVYPTIIKSGEAVYITSPTAGEFTMVDVSGRVIYTQGFSGPVRPIHVTVTQSGLYLGIIRTTEGTFTQKIIVLE